MSRDKRHYEYDEDDSPRRRPPIDEDFDEDEEFEDEDFDDDDEDFDDDFDDEDDR